MLNPNTKASTPFGAAQSMTESDFIGTPPKVKQSIPQVPQAASDTISRMASPSMPSGAGFPQRGRTDRRYQEPRVLDGGFQRSVSAQAAAVAQGDIDAKKAKVAFENYIAGGIKAAEQERTRLLKIFGDEAKDWFPPTYFFKDKDGNFMPVEYAKALLVSAQNFSDFKRQNEKDQLERDKYKDTRDDKARAQLEKQDEAPYQKEYQKEVVDIINSDIYKSSNSEELANEFLRDGFINAYEKQALKAKQETEKNAAAAEVNQRRSGASLVGEKRAEYSQIQSMKNSANSALNTANNNLIKAQKSYEDVNNEIAQAQAEIDKNKTLNTTYADSHKGKTNSYYDGEIAKATTNMNSLSESLSKKEKALNDAKKKMEESKLEKDAAFAAEGIFDIGEASSAADAKAIAKKNLKKGPTPNKKNPFVGNGRKESDLNPEVFKIIRKNKILKTPGEDVATELDKLGWDITILLELEKPANKNIQP